ncbi:polysaccharide biosynthesis C-terminal domain-containing protein [Priestia sp. Y58]|nr:lipid II flippase MurJ [Priestia sp. Y58]MDG0032748.1 polysaccharide biosynthesis C-terminal domain-containing protein [Priestia sp. Y58]
MMKKLSVISLILLFATLVLKFSSMLRDILISRFYGLSGDSDAYFAAVNIPNICILFLLTGIKETFLPKYFQFKELNGKLSYTSMMIRGTFYIALIGSIIGVLISLMVIPLLFSSFNQQGKQIAVWTAIYYFLSLGFVGINSIYEGYLEANRKFAWSILSQLIVVLFVITGLIFFHKEIGILSIPLFYLIGTIVSFFLKKAGFTYFYRYREKVSLDWSKISEFYVSFLPIGLTAAVGQINLSVDASYASHLDEGIVSSFNYAFRLVNIPQAIFGVTVATMIYPIIAKAFHDKDIVLFKKSMEKGLVYMFLLLAPAIVGMCYLMPELVKVIYTNFSDSDAALTSTFAIFFLGSVLAYSIQAVIAKGLYTLDKGSVFLKAGLFSVFLNVGFNFIFVKFFGAYGLALSSSLVGLIYCAITFSSFYKLVNRINLKWVVVHYIKISLSAIVMLTCLIYLKKVYFLNFTNLYFYLGFIIIGGTLIYTLFVGIFNFNIIYPKIKVRMKK